ncbi:MAG: hypothetical protein IJS74_03110 [Clostridia bacterium]|nr:hypothetical protein [Clostridia bacterium]
MNNKKDLISGIIFGIYFAMTVLLIPMVFFYGQIVGGGIYFVCFAITIAYFILDLKFEFTFKKFYRFFIYINDIINILALSLFVYYGIYIAVTIPTLTAVSLALLFDIICRDRIRSKSKANITTNVASLMVMAAIFPYFYFDNLDFSVMIIAFIFALVMLVCKIYLTIFSYENRVEKEAKEKKSEIEQALEANLSDTILE